MAIAEKEILKREYIQLVQNSIKEIVPQEVRTLIKEVTAPFVEIKLGVLIGVTGSIRAKVLLSGEESVFKKISEAMFGMSLEGEMLDSFTGELGNMMAGNFSIQLSKMEVPIDITAPAIFKGESMISGFSSAAVVKAELPDGSPFSLYLLMDN